MSTPSLALLSSPEILEGLSRLLALTGQSGTLFQVEQELREFLRLVNARLLDRLSEKLEERDLHLPTPSCQRCQRAMRVNRRESRTLQFQEGPLSVRRRYWECRSCKERLFLLDRDLELPGSGEVTPRFGHVLCLLGVELPFGAAQRLLREVTGREIDAGTIRNQVHRDGQALVDLETQEAKVYSDILLPGRRARQLKALPRLRSVPVPGKTLVVEIDGVFANLSADPKIRELVREWRREQDKEEIATPSAPDLNEPIRIPPTVFREVLNLRVYRLEDRIETRTRSGKIRGSLTRSETVTVVNDPELFRKRAYATLQAWKVGKYKNVVVLGDGGVFQRHLEDFLGPTHEILDLCHAKQHIHGVARALWGEGTKESRHWGKRWSDSATKKGPEPLLEELQKLSSQSWSEEGARKLGNLVNYVTEHRQRMRYPCFRKLGFPVGTGAIESANRQVVGDRCKRSGMGWSQVGLQALLSLRAALLSGNWDLACTAIRYERFHREARKIPLPAALEPVFEEAIEEAVLAPSNPRPSRPRPRPLIPQRKLAKRIQSGLLQVEPSGRLISADSRHRSPPPQEAENRNTPTSPRPPSYKSRPGVLFPFGAPKAP